MVPKVWLFNENVAKITAQRASLPPWVTPASPHKMNKQESTRKLAVKTQKHQFILKVLELEQKLESIKMTKLFLRMKHSNLANSVKFKKNCKLRNVPDFPYEMILAEEKNTN